MEIRVIDFQELTKHYKNYREGIKKLEGDKNDFLKKIEPYQKKMNDIIKQLQSDIITDGNDNELAKQKFERLKMEAIEMDETFKEKFKEMKDDLNSKTFDELSVFIEDWSIGKDIDMVTGRMEVVYNKEKYNITEDILNILKEKNLFLE